MEEDPKEALSSDRKKNQYLFLFKDAHHIDRLMSLPILQWFHRSATIATTTEAQLCRHVLTICLLDRVDKHRPPDAMNKLHRECMQQVDDTGGATGQQQVDRVAVDVAASSSTMRYIIAITLFS